MANIVIDTQQFRQHIKINLPDVIISRCVKIKVLNLEKTCFDFVAMPESTYLKLLNITSYENTFPVV
jgi:hypothetical protein